MINPAIIGTLEKYFFQLPRSMAINQNGPVAMAIAASVDVIYCSPQVTSPVPPVRMRIPVIPFFLPVGKAGAAFAFKITPAEQDNAGNGKTQAGKQEGWEAF